MGEVVKLARQMFKGWVILAYLLFYSIIVGVYMYILTRNVFVSILVGIICSPFLFYGTNMVNKEIHDEQTKFDNINKYVTMMVAYLKTNSPPLLALKAVHDKVDEVIQEPIRTAITSILEAKELDTSGFDKFGFTALNVFHRNLEVILYNGGNPDEIFKTTTEDINQELTYRDKLKRAKTMTSNEIYLTLAIVLAIPLILTTNDIVYNVILSMPFVPYSLSAGLVMIATAIYTLTSKAKKDVQITV